MCTGQIRKDLYGLMHDYLFRDLLLRDGVNINLAMSVLFYNNCGTEQICHNKINIKVDHVLIVCNKSGNKSYMTSDPLLDDVDNAT